MSATTETPLGGFERRLLKQLQAEVAARPADKPVAAPRRRSWRVPIPPVVTAAVTALVVALLGLLPATAPSLAQAFPIVTEPGQALPVALARVLRAQWPAGKAPGFDLGHAYAFSTPTGTGYVVVDRRARWLCILVPGFSGDRAAGRCEQVTLARTAEPVLSLRITGLGRQEIVALLPRGATGKVISAATQGGSVTSTSTSRRGVLAIFTHGSAKLITKLAGHSSTTTYRP